VAYGLAAHVSFCRFPDRLIFLDIARDRYFAAPLRDDGTAEWEARLSEAMTARLVEQGLLVASEPMGAFRPVAATVPLQSLVESNDARPRVPLMPAAIVATIQARYQLGRRPLKTLLDEVRRRPLSVARAGRTTPSLEALTASFHRARRLLPFIPRCLPDSLALLRYLDRFGYHPTLIFGVLAHPFAAHCWVQDDQCILNDAHGHAALFTPILIV
jgi:hypothetical protein